MFIRFITFSVALSVSASSYAAQAQDNFNTLREQLGELKARHNIPVLAVAIAQGDEPITTIVLGGTTDTLLRWGSITKTFTALTVLALEQESLLDLNAPLHQYVDDRHWQNRWQAAAPIRLIHLLELRAGFTDLSAEEFNYNTPISLAAALRLKPEHRRTLWPPGLQHGYSNMTPGLTQLLIESATKTDYPNAVRKHVFDPLGMQTAGFTPTAVLPGGFKSDGTTPIPYWHMTFPAYGALNASLSEIARLMTAALTQSTFSDTVWTHLLAPHGRSVTPEFTFDYAAGFYPRVRKGFVWHGHGGDADGYRSRIAILGNQVPGELHVAQRGYVANINTDNPKALRQIERLLETYLTQNLPSPPPPQPAPISDNQLQSLAGSYYPASARFGVSGWQKGSQSIVSIKPAAGALTFNRGERATKLIPAGGNQFRRQNDPVATIVFVRNGKHTYLQGELGNFVRLDNCPEFLSTLPQCDHPKFSR